LGMGFRKVPIVEAQLYRNGPTGGKNPETTIEDSPNREQCG